MKTVSVSVLHQHILKCKHNIFADSIWFSSFENWIGMRDIYIAVLHRCEPKKTFIGESLQIKEDVILISWTLRCIYHAIWKQLEPLDCRKDGMQLQFGLFGQRMDRELGWNVWTLQLSHSAPVMQPSECLWIFCAGMYAHCTLYRMNVCKWAWHEWALVACVVCEWPLGGRTGGCSTIQVRRCDHYMGSHYSFHVNYHYQGSYKVQSAIVCISSDKF